MKNRNERALIFATLAWALASSPLGATGYYGPSEYLRDGWQNMVLAPEFYWELETKRMSSAYHPDEKFLTASAEARSGSWASEDRMNSLGELTASADSADFAAALKSGAIKPADAAKATAQHEAMRKGLATGLPEEFDSEFSDYHRGALAYRLGEDHWDEAVKAWETLLKRPEAERHYRTVWATFMLGKIAMKRQKSDAVGLFQRTRALAKAGFADSLGLAADSYGWEARSEWQQGHPEKAAPLFLTQLALGDESAIHSLKALIPDRLPIDGMLNYGPEPVLGGGPDGDPFVDLASPEMAAAVNQLKVAAADPLLRRIVTMHILSTETYRVLSGGNPDGPSIRSTRWLGFIKEAKPKAFEDAEYLGWIAYSAGKYAEAAEWLKLAKPDAPASCWLRSKLERRAGKLADAQASMAKAFAVVRKSANYTGWSSPSPDEEQQNDPFSPTGESWTFRGAAAGNLGALHLERAEFIDALVTFLEGGLWDDAAFIAERILTTDELKAYVDKQAPAAPAAKDEETDRNLPAALRYLLGRRLVREDRYAEAGQYLKPPYDKVLNEYAQALTDGANEKLPKAKRARAWFHAAWLARYDGMELMGTEVAPDSFVTEGSFPSSDLVSMREGKPIERDSEWDSDSKKVVPPIAPTPSKEELKRLKQNRINPEVRFHYRVIAAALAMRAAALMPDNTEELADVIIQAGRWVSDQSVDEKLANRYYQLLEKRCRSTKTAAATLKKGNFMEQTGPWSSEEEAARKPREE